MTLSFTDAALIERIIQFLGKIKGEVSHPELEIILDKLTNLQSRYSLKETESDELHLYPDSESFTLEEKSESTHWQARKFMKLKLSRKLTLRSEDANLPMAPAPSSIGYSAQITWENVFNSLINLPDVN
jgi:hypothetical protein